MESIPSDPPIIAPKRRPPSWFSVWAKIVTSPKEQTFVDIMDHPDAKQNTAFIWIFVTGLLPVLVWGLLQAILTATGLDGRPASLTGRGVDVFLILTFTVCPSPIVGAFVVAIFGLSVGCLQWVARIMGGTGSYEKLVYILGVIYVPLLVVSPIAIVLALVLVFENMLLFWIIGIVEFLVVVYTLVLQTIAVKVVNHLWWSEAIGLALLSSVGILVSFGCCLFFGIFGAA